MWYGCRGCINRDFQDCRLLAIEEAAATHAKNEVEQEVAARLARLEAADSSQARPRFRGAAKTTSPAFATLKV